MSKRLLKGNMSVLDFQKDKIFCWMFDGLRRLIANNYRFTISDKANPTAFR